MQDNIEFIQTHYKEQINALNSFYPIIESAISKGMPRDSISFGGGTALAIYHFNHRLSFDIDLFINDIQYLSFLSPKHWIDDEDNFNSNYIEKFNHISLSTSNNIKIDILANPKLDTNTLDNSKSIFKFDIYIESIASIIAKKIVYRNSDNKTRDIFDIAVALEDNPKLFNNLLDLKAINKEHLKKLKESLKNINYDKYINQIKDIQPFKDYKDISNNAIKIIQDNISKIQLSNTKQKSKSNTKQLGFQM